MSFPNGQEWNQPRQGHKVGGAGGRVREAVLYCWHPAGGWRWES